MGILNHFLFISILLIISISKITSKGMNGTVCTFYELLHGDDTRSAGMSFFNFFMILKSIFVEFHNIDPHLFRRVLMELEKRGQATVFSDNGAEGVKFS